MKSNRIQLILALIVIVLIPYQTEACSMYKVSVGGKTMVGCNEDAWRTTSRIWFENAKKGEKYGAAFTGSRLVSKTRTAPQSGMNEVGLVFSRLTSWYPQQENPFPNRKKITDEVEYLSGILHHCATTADVRKYIEQYDHSFFDGDVYLFIDSSGNYLIVEPYQLIDGNDPAYVLANFCPSITSNEKARKYDRYRKGEDFLKIHEHQSSLAYCTALSDTMHVRRKNHGDGTLLTSIWNTQDGLVNLYFYHAYDSTIQYNISEELAKGDHLILLPELFPYNPEFEHLKSYLTPYNTPPLRISLAALGALLIFIAFLLGLVSIFRKQAEFSPKQALLLALLNILLTGLLMVLATDRHIFYFEAPYQHYNSNWISAAAFVPFLLLLLIFPITVFTISRIKSQQIKSWIKTTLLLNNLIYFVLMLGFGYWGLYSIWN